MSKKLYLLTIFILILITSSVYGAWIKVNGSNPIDNGEPLETTWTLFYTVKNNQGDLLYFFNYDTMGTVMGKFCSGGASPSKKWEVYSNGQWNDDSNAIATSISNTLALYDTPMKLYPLQDSNEGLFGVTQNTLMTSNQNFDIHGSCVNIMFDDTNGWRQWKSGITYNSHYFTTLISSWNGISCDFAFDSNSRTGILVGTKGYSLGGYMPKLTASKYVLDDNSQKWHRWDNYTSGGWYTNNSWPGDTEISKFHILDPNATASKSFPFCRIVQIDSGDYLVVFDYTSGSTTITSACRYNEGTNPTWSWWNGSGWITGGSYNYSTIVNGGIAYKTPKLLAVDTGKASLFYISSNNIYEATYNETGANPVWTTAAQVTTGYSYDSIVDTNNSIWLYYTIYNDCNVYLRTKTSGGSWSAAETVYSSQDTAIKVLGANFVNNDIPVCFITEEANNIKRIYAISDSDWNSYWSGETPLALDSINSATELDPRIQWQNQVLNSAPDKSYGANASGHMAIDSDGYLYSPQTTVCTTIVRHKNILDTNDANCWGGFWDHFYFPGGCAVDNIKGNVYIANYLISGGCGSTLDGGYIKKFSMDKRTTSIGYAAYGQTLPSSWDKAYSPQQFASASWPADVAVNETQGRLYVISALEHKIKVYDIENTVNNTGSSNKFNKSGLEYGFSGDNLTHVKNIIEELVDTNDPNIYLVEYASDANYAYWDPNSENLEDTISFVKSLSDYGQISTQDYRDRLVRQLSYYYKAYWDRPVYLGDSNCIGSKGSDDGEFIFPQGIDIDPCGYIYVADTGNHRIQKFEPNGTFIKSWGSFGYDQGQFIYPFSVAADPHYNLVYVTDPFNHRVQFFDKDGNSIYSWSYWDSENDSNSFSHTYGLVADGEGNIFIGVKEATPDNHYIVKFSIACPNIDDNNNLIPDTLEGLKFVINASAETGAIISPNGNSALDPNGSQAFTIEVNDGYFARVFVDDVSQGDITTYQFTDVNTHHTIKVMTGKVLNVNKGEIYGTINAAIDEASNGDEIVVATGTYNEFVTFDNKSIILRGTDPNDWNKVDQTIISNQICFGWAGQTGDTNSILAGIKTTAIVYCFDSSPTIKQCIINGIWPGIEVDAGDSE